VGVGIGVGVGVGTGVGVGVGIGAGVGIGVGTGLAQPIRDNITTNPSATNNLTRFKLFIFVLPCRKVFSFSL
jgi:hypothetical protein